MSWQQFVDLYDFEHDNKTYEQYYAGNGYMLVSGYDDATSEKFILVAEAEFSFDKDANKRKQLQKAIVEDTLTAPKLEALGIKTTEIALPNNKIEQDRLAEDIGEALGNGQSVGYSINYALLRQYNTNNPKEDALRLTTQDTIRELKEKYPEGPKSQKQNNASKYGVKINKSF